MSAEDYDMLSSGEEYDPETSFPEEYSTECIFQMADKCKCCDDIFEAIVHQHTTCFLNYLNSYYTNIDYVDPDYGKSALEYAIGTGNIEYAELIIKHGADLHFVDGEGNNILTNYILNNYTEFGNIPHYDVIFMLMDHGVSVQYNVIVALLRMEEYELIRHLINRGFNPNYIASIAKKEEIELYIDLGVDSITDMCGKMSVS